MARLLTQIQVNEIIKIKESLTKIYEKHNSAGKTYEQLQEAMERDNFMSATEAVAFGLADKVIEQKV